MDEPFGALDALTSEALTAACLARVAEREPTVRAFADLKPEEALARARELDRRKPRDDEPLYGVPVAVKEVFDVAASLRPGHALLVVGPLRARVAAASEQAVRRAAEALGRAGVTVTRIELPADFDRIEWITYTLL